MWCCLCLRPCWAEQIPPYFTRGVLRLLVVVVRVEVGSVSLCVCAGTLLTAQLHCAAEVKVIISTRGKPRTAGRGSNTQGRQSSERSGSAALWHGSEGDTHAHKCKCFPDTCTDVVRLTRVSPSPLSYRAPSHWGLQSFSSDGNKSRHKHSQAFGATTSK